MTIEERVRDGSAIPLPAVYDALRRLAEHRLASERTSPAAGAVVRLRFYAGLSTEQAAEALGSSPSAVKRKWAYARAWLFEALSSDQGD